MKILKNKIFISIIVIISLFLSYEIYRNYLINKLSSCEQVFYPDKEFYHHKVNSIATYKLYKWKSETFDCEYTVPFRVETLEFLNDSTILFSQKSCHLSDTYLFQLSYLFNSIKYTSKEYEIYSVKNDTLFRLVNPINKNDPDFYYKEGIEKFEIISVPFDSLPYVEYATFTIQKDVLVLSYFHELE